MTWQQMAVGGVFALVLVGTVTLAIERRGYERGMDRCRAQQAEIERANREAIERAAERLMREASELSEKNRELEDALEDLETAAAAAPGADLVCLDAGSVGRLQSIR